MRTETATGTDIIQDVIADIPQDATADIDIGTDPDVGIGIGIGTHPRGRPRAHEPASLISDHPHPH
jgi:hypothetical protein